LLAPVVYLALRSAGGNVVYGTYGGLLTASFFTSWAVGGELMTTAALLWRAALGFWGHAGLGILLLITASFVAVYVWRSIGWLVAGVAESPPPAPGSEKTVEALLPAGTTALTSLFAYRRDGRQFSNRDRVQGATKWYITGYSTVRGGERLSRVLPDHWKAPIALEMKSHGRSVGRKESRCAMTWRQWVRVGADMSSRAFRSRGQPSMEDDGGSPLPSYFRSGVLGSGLLPPLSRAAVRRERRLPPHPDPPTEPPTARSSTCGGRTSRCATSPRPGPAGPRGARTCAMSPGSPGAGRACPAWSCA
jgi:hypothetical protein